MHVSHDAGLLDLLCRSSFVMYRKMTPMAGIFATLASIVIFETLSRVTVSPPPGQVTTLVAGKV